MANYISVPRDFSRVKSKAYFNLTKRQLVCFTLAAIIGVPSFFLIKRIGSTTVACLGMMIVMMPLFFLAMYEKNGEPLEVYLEHFIDAVFKRPRKRPYKTKNYYDLLAKVALQERRRRGKGKE
ncbi:PrgI family protein [Butyrivibrio sp. CB08]|uniref:PrgI family protein n=1 Tax=Butyrivibrio sp. CB08 TaxID=2364879 RepID=UPI000EAA79F7|nr:PrgI family protein [Butyrivibrio sp. CB08]RKM56777.1 PrgI family protein [Butyrivibrio sp. CB08]